MRVLVYGDSNSWGYLDDGLVLRFADRWPVEMARALAAQGRPVELVEECLPGRTTNLTDPKMGDFVDGAAPFEAILRSHIPLDLILIMLGTNDVKAHFGRSTDEIIGGLMALRYCRGERGLARSRPGWRAVRLYRTARVGAEGR